VNGWGTRLYRAALHAYPADFRQEYGDELVRSVHDLRQHARIDRRRLGLRLLGDVATTAPRMRMEHLMSRGTTVAVVVLGTILVIAAAVGSPVLLLGIVALVGLGAVFIRRHDRPIVADGSSTAHWYRWVAAGVASFGIGFVALAIDGDDELSESVWAICAASWALGLVLVLFGAVLATAHLVGRRAA